MDKFALLYNKILDGQDWNVDDLDNLLELSKNEGYLCGKLGGKQLLRECYNVITGSTGLDLEVPKPKNESSLLKRVMEFINDKE